MGLFMSNENAETYFSCSFKPVLRMTCHALFIYLKEGEFNIHLGSDL